MRKALILKRSLIVLLMFICLIIVETTMVTRATDNSRDIDILITNDPSGPQDGPGTGNPDGPESDSDAGSWSDGPGGVPDTETWPDGPDGDISLDYNPDGPGVDYEMHNSSNSDDIISGFYTILESPDDWNGIGDVVWNIDAPIDEFVCLISNGREIDPEYYSVTSGSTIITVKEEYLMDFPAFTYEFFAEFTEGFVSLTLYRDLQTVTNTQTAEVGNTTKLLWFGFGFGSAAVIAVIVNIVIFHTPD